MQRPMNGFHLDDEGHWVAELSCGHAQHVRHQPPFWLRPWVLTEEGRSARLGQTLDCVLCDRRQMPLAYQSYKRTPLFTQSSLPAGLRRQHRTKAGVWGLVHVQEGTLELHEVGRIEPEVVSAGQVAVVLPEVEHHVVPVGEVELFVEFWRPAS